MKILAAKIGAFVRHYLIPNVLLGREKAIAATVTPFLIAQLAQLVPGVHVSASLVQQLVGSALIGLTVHTTTNTQK